MVKRIVIGFKHGGEVMVIWDMVKWRKMKEWLDGEIAYTGLVAREKKDLNEERKIYLEGYRNALNYVKSGFEKINDEYEGYKKESTRTVKIELRKEDIKECFIKAMEETLKELKQK